MNLSDVFVSGMPTEQKIADLFRHQWSSNLAVPNLETGMAQLFYDERIDWFVEQIGSVKGKSILELGPLEGGHSWMMEQQGAISVTAIEANSLCYLKCLIAKELTQLSRTRFLLGDFVEFLRHDKAQFDVCIASGVLYHLLSPVEVIALIAERCQSVMIWTHYYDAEAIQNNPGLDPAKFTASSSVSYGGFEHRLHRYEYLDALALEAFCGGTAAYSHWLEKAALIGALKHFGFDRIETKDDRLDHPNGPCITIAAWKE